IGWYATTRGFDGGHELGAEINAWLGPAYLSVFETVDPCAADPVAEAMRSRTGGVVYRFSGSDQKSNQLIGERLAEVGALLKRRPATQRLTVRPVGSIRSDFERALLAQDAVEAEALIGELRETGRLNEENLRYIDVRLKAGLGLWPQIARDHWLIQTLSDLALPPQTLADLLEALYRTYVDDVEAGGDPTATLNSFELHIARRYPRLFASRRGIRVPRIIKSFVLFEQLQSPPNPQIIAGLLELLPESDRALFPERPPSAAATPAAATSTVGDVQADEAFDDAQYDRALEFYLALPLSRKSISRLLSCVLLIGTDEAKGRLLAAIDGSDGAIVAELAPAIRKKLENLRSRSVEIADAPRLAPTLPEWMVWAEQLYRGEDLAGAEEAVQQAATNWDLLAFAKDENLSKAFADIVGNLNGDAGAIVRRSVPQIFASFFPPGAAPLPATKPIGAMLFVLIAMDDVLSRTDLDLLAQLQGQLLAMGLSSGDYLSLVGDLADVQNRVSSYAYLPWSLDVCEVLAIAPSPSEAGRDARLRLFLQVLGQAQSFAHRLGPQDLLPIEFLARDYGVEADTISWLKPAQESNAAAQLPSLNGQTIGIYTLAEAAGSRAKAALEQMFPGCKIAVNSDLVCTPQLKSLAKASDMFIFAWKSSSHQAFYCVKDALVKGEPIWAFGKGTASILRAVLDNMA
ncbi:MAG TPA: protein DpdD, partial [Stellaceae bacterium]|nr:protein DpdD [Stellaceae bacterium]